MFIDKSLNGTFDEKIANERNGIHCKEHKHHIDLEGYFSVEVFVEILINGDVNEVNAVGQNGCEGYPKMHQF